MGGAETTQTLARKAQEMALMAQMGEIANGLVHEIRNPLNALRFNLKSMEEDVGNFPDDIRDAHLELIRRAGRQIEQLEDLLSEYLSYVRPGMWEAEP